MGFVLNARATTAPVLEIPFVAVEENYIPSPFRVPNGAIFDPYSCVSFAKAITGHPGEVWGNAWQIEANAAIPWPGYLVLLNEGRYGHVSVIQKIEGNLLYVVEANYYPGTVSRRVIPIDYPAIRGFRIP